jgi:protein-disulfide isomerase
MKVNIKLIVFVFLTFLLFLSACKTETPTGKVITDQKADSLEVVFYVMSQCSYGLQAENSFKPVLDKFKDYIDFRLEFVGLSEEGIFQSLHGESEINGNKVQLCAQKYNPEYFMDLVICMNKDYSKIPDNWESCADGLDKKKIKECYEGDEGNKLLHDSFEKSQKENIMGSPTMFFNGEIYNGERDENGFTRVICRNLKDNELCEDVFECSSDLECPASEGKIPVCENPGTPEAKCSEKDDAKVNSIILTSDECVDCDITFLAVQLKSIIPNLEAAIIDISSEEGKELVGKYNIEKVPVMFFTKSLKDTFLWSAQGENLQSSFDEFDDLMMIKAEQTNAHFFVDKNKRMDYIENLGVTLGDNRPQIDFFLMAFCPFGDIAEEGIAPVYELLKGKADFNPHYVIYSNYRGGGNDFCFDDEAKYCSMKGIQELNQGVRELCAAKHLGLDAFFSFALAINKKCNYQNADSCWEDVAKDLGLDVSKIKKCFSEEAESILEEELKWTKLYGATGSPQVFIDGTAYNGARDSNSYKEALCRAFDDAPEECKIELSTASEGSSGSC